MTLKAVTRNPDWSHEELVLAAEFYRQNAPKIPGKSSAALIELSNEILSAAAMQGLVGTETFRNPNGVYMKLMELRKYDPSYAGTGLGHGKSRAIEADIMNTARNELETEAQKVRARIEEFSAEGGDPADARGIQVTSEVLKGLAESDQAIERALANTLVYWQEEKRKSGRTASLGYEPRDIRRDGAVAVIEKRVLGQSSGFEEVPPEQTYEHIVLTYPEEFSAEARRIAQERIDNLTLLQATPDRDELSSKVNAVLARPDILRSRPEGKERPETQEVTVTQYLRDPRVVAYVLSRAGGACEACNSPAPFTRADGTAYLETHHILPLAEGGPDTVENCAALCPNCHRAMHSACDKLERAEALVKTQGEPIK